MDIDPRHVDEVLATTRAVRRRLDLERPVDNQLLLDCIDLAEQAPTGGNLGSRRWIIVREQRVKDQLGELYRETALPFMSADSANYVHLALGARYRSDQGGMLRLKGRPESNVASYYVDTGEDALLLEARLDEGPFAAETQADSSGHWNPSAG